LLGRIVDTKTKDGIQLHGFLATPNEPGRCLWLIVHGVNGNFYSSTLLTHLAQSALSLGNGALLINTRGHDLASFGSSDLPARLGSMFESIEEAVLDLSAWIAFAHREGFSRVGVMAHSLGAVKVGYALAHELSGIERWVALSPPRLNTELLLRDPAKCQVFQQHLEDARGWCKEGKENHILRVRFPLPNWVSARTFVDKYGSGDKYDYLAWCHRISIRTLWVFGGLEVRDGSANFRDADRNLEEQLAPDHMVKVIDSADHSYRASRAELWSCLSEWIER
jgi:hypothetical protein